MPDTPVVSNGVRWFSTRSLVIALAHGILSADPFFQGYEPPPGFERVLRDFASGFAEMENEDGCFQLLDEEARESFYDFVRSHPICKGWNSWDDTPENAIAIQTRYSPRPKAREFIDLDAICQNAWWATLQDQKKYE